MDLRAQQLLKKARTFVARGREALALETYSQLCSIEPRDPQLWSERGDIALRVGDLQEASKALFYAADLYTQQGAAKAALLLCQRVVEIDPDHAGAHRFLRMLRRKTQSKRAFEKREQARPIPPSIKRHGSGNTQDLKDSPKEQVKQNPTATSGRKKAESVFDGITLTDSTQESRATQYSLNEDKQMRVVQAVAANICSSPLLSELDSDLVRYLIECASMMHAPTGKRIVDQGDNGTSLYLVLQGCVSVERRDPKSGKQKVITRLRQGTFFGEMALLTDSPRLATVTCLQPTTLLEISRDAVRELIQRDDRVLKLLMRFFRARMVTNLVATSELFSAFTANECRMITTRFQLRELPSGYVVVEEGVPTDGLYVVLVGRLKVFAQGEGTKKEVGQLLPGDVFAEMSLLGDEVATASVETDQRVWLLRLPRADFQELVAEHPQLRDRLDQIAAARRTNNDGAFRSLSITPV